MRDPQRQQTEHAARLLKARQLLPLTFKDRQHYGMEGIGCLKGRSGMIDGKPGRDLGPILTQPVCIVVTSRYGVTWQQDFSFPADRFGVPFKQASPNDLRGF